MKDVQFRHKYSVGVCGGPRVNILMHWWKKIQIDIQWSKLMCDQVPTPGRRHVADGWSMVRSQRWLIGYTFHHQKSYVVPTLGQPYQPNGWVAHVGPTSGERWHANCDVRPTIPIMYQRWINVLLLTGIFASFLCFILNNKRTILNCGYGNHR